MNYFSHDSECYTLIFMHEVFLFVSFESPDGDDNSEIEIENLNNLNKSFSNLLQTSLALKQKLIVLYLCKNKMLDIIKANWFNLYQRVDVIFQILHYKTMGIILFYRKGYRDDKS